RDEVAALVEPRLIPPRREPRRELARASHRSGAAAVARVVPGAHLYREGRAPLGNGEAGQAAGPGGARSDRVVPEQDLERRDARGTVNGMAGAVDDDEAPSGPGARPERGREKLDPRRQLRLWGTSRTVCGRSTSGSEPLGRPLRRAGPAEEHERKDQADRGRACHGRFDAG